MVRGGYFGRYLPSGHLTFVHQGTLFAVPFDLSSLQLRGMPIPVLEDVAGAAGWPARFFANWNLRLSERQVHEFGVVSRVD